MGESTRVTYRIHRSVAPETIVFALSGEVDTEHADRLQKLLANEADDRIVLDLRDVTLVDRAAVEVLARMEGPAIRIVNCPEYVRSWIAAERSLREPGDKEPRS